MKMWFYIAGTIVLLILSTAAYLFFHTNDYVEVICFNKTDEKINRIQVVQGQNKFEFEFLAPQKKGVIRYKTIHGSSEPFSILVTFESGRVLKKSMDTGFGQGEEVVFNVWKDDLSMIHQKVLSP